MLFLSLSLPSHQQPRLNHPSDHLTYQCTNIRYQLPNGQLSTFFFLSLRHRCNISTQIFYLSLIEYNSLLNYKCLSGAFCFVSLSLLFLLFNLNFLPKLAFHLIELFTLSSSLFAEQMIKKIKNTNKLNNNTNISVTCVQYKLHQSKWVDTKLKWWKK